MSRFRLTRYIALVGVLVWTTIFLLLIYETLMVTETPIVSYKQTSPGYTTVLSDLGVRRTRPKILLWTTFFGEMTWYENARGVFREVCKDGCTLTADKGEIESADAVVFHLADITWQGQLQSGFKFSFPKYRRPDQVWVLYNLEPLTMIWGDFGAWQGLFNWTWSYHRSADVYTPYGMSRRLNRNEVDIARETYSTHDFYGAKNASGAVALISHCTDDARRYRLVEHLKSYIPVQAMGKCGRPCPAGYNSCNGLFEKHRFYLAFENSDCVDYVSEKYWRALQRNQIPIVAWRNSMDELVIPGSYINLYDFPDMDAAGRYIRDVNRNASLYNSYFEWRFTHRFAGISGFCKLCQMLQNASIPRKVYNDMYGSLSDNTCKQLTLPSLLHRMYDRFMYDRRVH